MRLKGAYAPVVAACLAGAVGLGVHLYARYALDPASPHTRTEQPDMALSPRTDTLTAAALPPLPSPAPKEEPAIKHQVVEVGKGDTLLGVLVEAAVPREQAALAIDALRSVYNPKSLKIGQEIAVIFRHEDGERHFVGLQLEPGVTREVSVSRGEDETFKAVAVDKPVERRTVAAAGSITSSLYESAITAGVPVSVMTEFIKNFSYDVDFQRDIQPNDTFRVLYARDFTKDGEAASEGEILYAALVLSGKEVEIYRHTLRDGTIDFFNGKGEGIRKALLRTPVDGAKLTSGFGMRRHPILGYSKMHKGVDFGAPTGTPIYAAGNGTIEEIGVKGAYGNYIRVRHNSTISTAYAHLSRFAAGARRGQRVRQGEVIGYVGTTGRSTGPHLHYEVLKDNRAVNPLSVDLPTGIQLEGKDLVAFRKVVEEREKEFAALLNNQQSVQVVSLKSTPKKCDAERNC